MTPDEFRRQELSDFLRTRRERISPTVVGLPLTHRRRTPGLRREEVAQMAGISATWYTWLEQKRPIQVSATALDSLARVLRLDPGERLQLFELARPQPVIDSTSRPETVSASLRGVLNQLDIMPAMVLGRRWDILAWNRSIRAFFLDFEQVRPDERNLLWLIFVDPRLRSLLVDWSSRAADTLARYRADYGRHAGDAEFVQMVEKIKSVSPEFREWWPRHDVHTMSEGRNLYYHPLVGTMVVEHTTFSMTDSPELRLLVFSAVAESNSIAKMQKVVAAFRNGTRKDLRRRG
jgi:transcriptional regulator with XRE-family HTH domain